MSKIKVKEGMEKLFLKVYQQFIYNIHSNF